MEALGKHSPLRPCLREMHDGMQPEQCARCKEKLTSHCGFTEEAAPRTGNGLSSGGSASFETLRDEQNKSEKEQSSDKAFQEEQSLREKRRQFLASLMRRVNGYKMARMKTTQLLKLLMMII